MYLSNIIDFKSFILILNQIDTMDLRCGFEIKFIQILQSKRNLMVKFPLGWAARTITQRHPGPQPHPLLPVKRASVWRSSDHITIIKFTQQRNDKNESARLTKLHLLSVPAD